MAVTTTRRRKVLAGCVCGLLPLAALAGETGPVRAHSFQELVSGARALIHDGTTHFESMLKSRFRALDRDTPQWLREQTRDGFDVDATAEDDSLQLVVQQDRRDGADLLTLRYPLMNVGGLRTYAGAGLSQAEYYAPSAGEGLPDVITRRNRHRSLGGAAELGAELRVTEQLRVNADLRWIDLDAEASLLRVDEGLVGADPVSVGISLGWRFR